MNTNPTEATIVPTWILRGVFEPNITLTLIALLLEANGRRSEIIEIKVSNLCKYARQDPEQLEKSLAELADKELIFCDYPTPLVAHEDEIIRFRPHDSLLPPVGENDE